MMEKHKIVYHNRVLEFELQRKNVKNINLNIKPNMAVIVSANNKVPLEYILKFVWEKAPWIFKNINYFKDTQSEALNEREFVSGETCKYLGKQYRLKVIEAEVEEVKYLRGFIYLYVKDKTNFKRKEMLYNNWLRTRAKSIFNKSLEKIYPLLEKYGVKKPELMIKIMKARWGSCVKDKNIILLNLELIKAPKFCIEYVLLHELIHFMYCKHDAQFYNFLSVLMPDWNIRKAILDEEVVRNL